MRLPRRFYQWVGMTLTLGVMAYCFGMGLRDGKERGVAPHAAAQPASPRVFAARDNRHTIVVDVAQRVSPAVVSIGVTRLTGERQFDPFGGEFFSPYNLIMRERDYPYLGSGFIIDQKGHTLTNYHVVQDANSINITLTDGRSFKAKLLDADSFVDIALLRIEGLAPGEKLPTIELGDSDSIMIGESVLAVGNPYGPLLADPRPSVSLGVVSAVNRSFRSQQQQIYQDMIQTDAAINPGNSGGPLINLDGEAIGINTFIFSRSGGSENIGFSIPSNRARRVVDEILKFGKVRDIRLDFEFINVSQYVVQVLGLKVGTGVLVTNLDAAGPADRAGLKRGDVIVAINKRAIADSRDLLDQFLSRTVGENIAITVRRGEQSVDLTYRIEEGGAR
ncbi:MAG: trypsin-like peptidase domain-containing protein [Candidatus Sumerlaeia bacterium]